MSGLSWIIIFYLGLGATALTLFLWNYALRILDASVASLYTSLIPVFGLLFAVLLGESTSWIQLTGGFLAIVGVCIGDWLTDRKYSYAADHLDDVEK
ncbi:drug/metabolite transporter (DMT)-like permease [Caldalkalibacillus uzonensis]|uniref:Drug/metabolite transporter (DMT)-like permease n=1 Tax=Caldalkalibacillus uzonensis TaxID=353224 RepID=A0ABU0CXG9_9BACI|nr:drug/metabolite transporter (DMT)-like permease [Caldalkalibacillus uzonensis]